LDSTCLDSGKKKTGVKPQFYPTPLLISTREEIRRNPLLSLPFPSLNPPPPSGRGRTKKGEGKRKKGSPLLNPPLLRGEDISGGGGGYRWGEGENVAGDHKLLMSNLGRVKFNIRF